MGRTVRESSGRLHGQLTDLQFWRTEVHQQPVLQSGGSEIAEQLRDVCSGDDPARFDLNDENSLDQQVGEVVAEQHTVLIPDWYRSLGDHVETCRLQPVGQSSLVDFLQMSVGVVAVQLVGGEADMIAQLEDSLWVRALHASTASDSTRLKSPLMPQTMVRFAPPVYLRIDRYPGR